MANRRVANRRVPTNFTIDVKDLEWLDEQAAELAKHMVGGPSNRSQVLRLMFQILRADDFQIVHRMIKLAVDGIVEESEVKA